MATPTVTITATSAANVVNKLAIFTTLDFSAARGASPLDIFIQYYGAKADMREIFNPLMLYWAERGFIEIFALQAVLY